MAYEIQKKSVTINGATYTITSEGKVYGAKGQLIKLRPNTSGYASFTAGKKGRRVNVTVHRKVAELFLPNPLNLPEVDHLDSDRMNPRLENLEWVEHSENIRRAYERGNHKGRAVGEKNTKAKLTEELVLVLRKEYKAGATIKELSVKYSHPWNTIGNAVKGITWSYLPL